MWLGAGASGLEPLQQGVYQGFGLVLELAVAAEFFGLLLMGQEVVLELFLHLLQLEQVEFGLILGLFKLLLQRLELALGVGHG